MKLIIRIFTLLAVTLGANFYVFYRLWYLLPAIPAIRILLVCVAVFLFFSPFIAFGLGNRFPFPVASIMYRVGTSWLIIMLYLVILFFISDMIRSTGLLQLNRFMFNSWTGFGVLSLFLIALLTTGNIIYHNKKRVELTLKTNKTVEPDRSLKIVAISDLHLGYGIGTKEFRKWVQLINREDPDMVLIAGDALDNRGKPLYDRNYAAVFHEIKTKFGIYMAPGNHEYISNITESIDFLTKAGVIVLRDSVALVDNAYYIVGRDDRRNLQRKSLAGLTASLDKSKPVILLDHEPYHFDEVVENNMDLYIAGHTHKGQVWPLTWITKAVFELSHGYLKKGNTHFYVSSGIGIWGGKFRIGSRSEYVVITMGS